MTIYLTWLSIWPYCLFDLTYYLTWLSIWPYCLFDLTFYCLSIWPDCLILTDCLSICHMRQLFLTQCLTDIDEFRNAIAFKTNRFSWKVLLHYLWNSSNMTCQLNAKLSNKNNSYTLSENLLFNHKKRKKGFSLNASLIYINVNTWLPKSSYSILIFYSLKDNLEIIKNLWNMSSHNSLNNIK